MLFFANLQHPRRIDPEFGHVRVPHFCYVVQVRWRAEKSTKKIAKGQSVSHRCFDQEAVDAILEVRL